MSAGDVRGRVGRRRRFGRLTAAGVAVATAFVAVAVGSTGAYFTGTMTTATQTASVGSLPAVTTLAAASSNAGKTANINWAAADVSALTAAGATATTPTYTLKRNTVNDFSAGSGAETVYTGPARLFSDETGAAPTTPGLITQIAAGERNNSVWGVIGGTVQAWGLLNDGGSSEAFRYFTPTTIAGFPAEGVKRIAAGRDHACAVSVSGELYCVGFNGRGQLASSAASSMTAAKVTLPAGGPLTGKTIADLDGGEFSMCALTSESKVACWGDNTSKQLGNSTAGTTSNVPVAVDLTSTYPIIDLSVGGLFSCVLYGPKLVDGVMSAPPQGQNVQCWGSNDQLQLGASAATTSSATPLFVADPNGALVGATKINAGYRTACVVREASGINVSCWGSDTSGGTGSDWTGMLGRTASGNSATPAPIAAASGSTVNLTGFTDVKVGSQHICATRGSVYVCWGANWQGMLGIGTITADPQRPSVAVDLARYIGDGAITDVAMAWGNSCAINDKGSLACWGATSVGQTAQPATSADIPYPTPAASNGEPMRPRIVSTAVGPTTSPYSRLSAGYMAGKVYVWGTSLPTTMWSYSTPTEITGFPANSVTQLALGGAHLCALTSTNKIFCAGSNVYGQLGRNNTTNSSTAVEIVDTNGVFTNQTIKKLVSFTYGTCALTTTGTIGCWGDNTYAQLGALPGAPTNVASSPVPRKIDAAALPTSGAGIPLDIDGGNAHLCASTAATVVCWGANGNGQVGNDAVGTYVGAPTVTAGTQFASGVRSVSAGSTASCAITNSGEVWCWGSNAVGLLGNGATTQQQKPVRATLVTPTDFTSIGVGAGFACAWSTAKVWCWGNNEDGVLGRGNLTAAGPGSIVDTANFTAAGIASLDPGSWGVCGTNYYGATFCWGNNGGGEAGIGGTTDQPTPIAVKRATVDQTGSAPACGDGASFKTGSNTQCTLAPTRTYYYQVTYSVVDVQQWISAPKSAART